MAFVLTSNHAKASTNQSLPLKGYTFCIDPGHQQKGNNFLEKIAPNAKEKKPKVSSGTKGTYTGVPEYKLTLSAGLVVRDSLKKQGATVVMTRTTNNVNISNSERAILANKNNCTMTIRLHADGSTNRSVNGYSLLIPGSKYTPKIVKSSVKMAKLVDTELKKNILIKSKGIVTRNDLTGFNFSTVPIVLIEMGYMTNKFDDEMMQTKEFQEAVALSITNSFVSYVKQK